MKRTTVHIFERGQFVDAMSVCRFLKQHGVDAVVVTKHAIAVSAAAARFAVRKREVFIKSVPCGVVPASHDQRKVITTVAQQLCPCSDWAAFRVVLKGSKTVAHLLEV